MARGDEVAPTPGATPLLSATEAMHAVAFHLRARRALRELLSRLEADGVAALPVKGCVLAHELYASPAERSIRDLDLRVQPRDLPRVAALFAREPNAHLVRVSRVFGNVVGYFEGFEIDIESHVGPPFVCALRVEELLARATIGTGRLGFPYRRIELHDHALLLSVNLFKDHARAHPWSVRDLELIAQRPEFDPRQLAERAAAGRCRTIVHVVARHLELTRGDARWADVAAQIAPARPRLATRMIIALAGGEPTLATRLSARGSSDRRVNAAAALAATALWSLTRRGSVVRPRR